MTNNEPRRRGGHATKIHRYSYLILKISGVRANTNFSSVLKNCQCVGPVMDFFNKRKQKLRNPPQPVDTLKREVRLLQDQADEILKQMDKEAAVKMAERVGEKIAEYDKMKEGADFEEHKIVGLLEELETLNGKLNSFNQQKMPVASPRMIIRNEKNHSGQTVLSPPQGKVEVNEIQENLKRMRQKRLNRLSQFVDEQQRLVEKRTDNVSEIEDSIKAFQKPSPKPSFKCIVQEKIIDRKESMESIDESSSVNEDENQAAQITEEKKLTSTPPERPRKPKLPLERKTWLRKSLETIPDSPTAKEQKPSSPRVSRVTKSLESPKTPNPNMKKIFSTFGSCAATDVSSDEDDLVYNKYASKKIAMPKRNIPKNDEVSLKLKPPTKGLNSPPKTDHLYEEIKNKNKETNTNGKQSLEQNNYFKDEVRDPKEISSLKSPLQDISTADLSVENPLYGYINLNTNQRLLEKLLENYNSLENILSDNEDDLHKFQLDSLLETIEETQTFLSKIQKKIRNQLKKKEEVLDEYRKTAEEILKEVEDFRGFRRDAKYLVLANKLTSLYSEVSRTMKENKLEDTKESSFLKSVNFIIKRLEDKVKKNEEILGRILEEQVIILGLRTFTGTEV